MSSGLHFGLPDFCRLLTVTHIAEGKDQDPSHLLVAKDD